MAVRIICINKEAGNHYDPHEAITYFGWVNEQTRATGKTSRMGMVNFIEKQGGRAYVRTSPTSVAYLLVRTSITGNKYVKAIADGAETDELLYLPECVD